MRRIFRRQIRRALAPEVPPILQEANFMFDKGEYGRAAELFEQIASAAEARGRRRAPLFHLQAGRARLSAGQTQTGMDHLKHGLSLFAARGQMRKIFNAGNLMISELTQRGLNKEAGEIDDYMKSILPSMPTATDQTVPARKPDLSTHCPSCGAAVRPDEVEWLDDITAECAYCGSPLREAK